MPTLKNRESSFDRDKREQAEHAAESKKTAKPTTKKETFTPSKGGIMRVDKAVWDANQ